MVRGCHKQGHNKVVIIGVNNLGMLLLHNLVMAS